MERKVKEEQRIEREANEKYPDNRANAILNSERELKAMRRAYIAGATKEAERNKEDAIGFVFWYLENSDKYPGSQTTEQLYEIYISGL